MHVSVSEAELLIEAQIRRSKADAGWHLWVCRNINVQMSLIWAACSEERSLMWRQVKVRPQRFLPEGGAVKPGSPETSYLQRGPALGVTVKNWTRPRLSWLVAALSHSPEWGEGLAESKCFTGELRPMEPGGEMMRKKKPKLRGENNW